MRCKVWKLWAAGALAGALLSCEKLDDDSTPYLPPQAVALEEVAQLFASLPIGPSQVAEVRDAALSSAGNGYDEEYRLRELFAAPGSGVGDSGYGEDARSGPSGRRAYERPLRELLEEAVRGGVTRSGAAPDGLSGDAFLAALEASDVQLYWPGSEAWDGESLPVITFDPGGYAQTNEGWELLPDGGVRKVLVSEQTSLERPVWVVNSNEDAAFKSLELRRREDPSWGSGGGDILVRSVGGEVSARAGAAASASDEIQTLVLRSFKACRQYDSWFAGGSEFFVKMGSAKDFKFSTEGELRLYKPEITDFMIVVKRSQVDQVLPFNAVLVSEWTKSLDSCAFMMIEDDGGTKATWKCNAVVKYNSKSFGLELEIPINSRDDIVWRGLLTRKFVQNYSGELSRFGDVELILELI